MIFEDVSNNTIRIPNENLCGVKRKDKCLLWCAGDNEGGTDVLYEVTSSMFDTCMDALGDRHFVNSRVTPDNKMSDEEYRRRLNRALIDRDKEGI